MPRAILGQLSPNHVRNHEYSPYTRAILYGIHRNRATSAVIANNENIPDSTVRTIFKNITINHHASSLYRSGRPKILNDYERRRIIRAVRRDPKQTYQ
jgi:hypothetical protein